MAVQTESAPIPAVTIKPGSAIFRQALRNPGVILGGVILSIMVFVAIFAPFLGTVDPVYLDPISRLKKPFTDWFLGTDAFGRDIYSRIIYGARISLIIGIGAAVLSIAIGLFVGLISGYFRIIDAIVMRIMDGLMAIPGILLAIALVSLSGASLLTVMVAITIPEIPRVVRLVRSVVLSIREEPYVEAAISIGTPLPLILIRHVMPNTFAPLIVQGTYICASAMLTEAILSFLGAGIPPEIPTWGNIMAEGRVYFQLAPWIILFPGIFLSLTVLAVNILGDGLRDTLDPRLAKRV
ncbi:ABC transporter permease [Oceanibaculum nanhaiense]|jgi:peptide/nickel transport system permease protein|uniref:ABC transporter permease n=1 Tax=Oceanibaculum nanhaiense TaxID=1909734 RepID=UPI0025A33E85|nr:ABC transporter permease [Oceanibaculum nanhaiense]MDM7946290.1 ABC transporter permease [Oceanibaculum nanhaiense]